jgi:hypothetical protein
MRAKFLLILAVFIIVGRVAAIGNLAGQADELQLTVLPSVGTGRQGSTLVFRASVKNLSNHTLNLNQLSLTLTGSNLLDGDPTEFYTNFAGALPAGATINDRVLFTVTVPSNTPIGTYKDWNLQRRRCHTGWSERGCAQ